MAVISSYVSKCISERLSPSKALQDAKKRLGPVYFDAKLVECPKNAALLSKLLNTLDDLDKQRLKIIDEGRKNQRILLHTLQSRYTFSKSSPTLSAKQSVRNIKLPPPGFRYHANGDPKLSLLQYSDSHFQSLGEHEDVLLKQTFIGSDCKLQPLEIENKSSTIFEESIETEEEIQEIENIIRELEEDVKRCKINVNNVGSAREKAMSFLRAYSQGEEALLRTASEPLTFSQPNDRFPFQPGSCTFADKRKSSTRKERPKSTLHSSCIACQYKLKHSSEDFKRLTNNVNKIKPKRWNIAPQGTLVKSPSSQLSTTSSIFYSKSKSKSSHASNRVSFNLGKSTQSELRNQYSPRPISSPENQNLNKLDNGIRSTKSSLSSRGRSMSSLSENRLMIETWKQIMEEETLKCNLKMERFLESLRKSQLC